MFTFPEETDTAHVKLLTTKQDLSAVTVCLRSFTDLRRIHLIFSLATASAFNDFLLMKQAEGDLLYLWVRDKEAEFPLQDYKLNTCNSICSTWNGTSGLTHKDKVQGFGLRADLYSRECAELECSGFSGRVLIEDKQNC
ncbi:C-reactive protein [Oreochromis niloticus]|uniref:C-reactive protein n=1 Tax=Oreochromis niloticus TaxID=8128 RepID=UPI000DF3F829|nr:C-reactive protein-like [Oreochromis niloticus]